MRQIVGAAGIYVVFVDVHYIGAVDGNIGTFNGVNLDGGVGDVFGLDFRGGFYCHQIETPPVALQNIGPYADAAGGKGGFVEGGNGRIGNQIGGGLDGLVMIEVGFADQPAAGEALAGQLADRGAGLAQGLAAGVGRVG